MAYKRLEWFCGTEIIGDPKIFLKNICLINFTYAVFHTTFALLFLLAVVTTYLKTRNHTYLLVKLPGHNLKWVFLILLLLLQLLAVCEGILTDRANSSATNRLYLYVPSICAFVTSIFAVLTSHCVELWRRKWPLYMLFIYWILSCGCEIMRFGNLIHLGLNNYQVVRFDIELTLLVIYGILCFIQAYSIGKTVMTHETALTTDNDEATLFVRESTSFPSKVFLQWVHRLLNLGYRKALTIVDLGSLPAEHLVALNHRKFDMTLQDELTNSSQSGDTPSLCRILWKNSWKILTASTILRCISDPIALITPFLIGRIIVYMGEMGVPFNIRLHDTNLEDTTPETFHFISLQDLSYNGWVLLMAIFVVNVLDRLCYWTSDYLLAIESLHVKVAVQAAVYQRSLQLSSMIRYDDWYSYQDSTQKLTNYMSNDADRIMLAVQKINSIFPMFMTFAVLALLYVVMGFAALWGFLAVVVLFPTFSIIGGCLSGFQDRAKIHAENRVKHTYEVLREIRFLKLNAWEHLFCEAIEKFRLKETCELCNRNLVYAFSVLGSTSSPLIMMAVSYGLYTVLEDKPLTAEVAFVALALFNLLDRYMIDIPLTLSSLVSGYASVKKLEQFILTPGDPMEPSENMRGKYELGLDVMKGAAAAVEGKKAPGNIMVKFTLCNTAWNQLGTFCEPVLKNINVEIETGKLTVVVGQVGCGKSAFLASILGEMKLISGNITFPSGEPTLALSSQKPWIENTTLQDNILCGLPMKRQRYSAVVSACALEQDMEVLPYGDLTELGGMGGIVLSSGQKQRVNLARAIYSSARLVILDDPLSAQDDEVGEHVFVNGIMGLLKRNNRTVVLVTNQLQYIQRADKVIILDQGKVYHQGPQESIVNVIDPSLLHRSQQSVGSEAERAALRKQVAQHQKYGEAAEARFKAKRARLNMGERSSLVSKDEEREHISLKFAVYFFLLNVGGWSLFASIVGFGGVQAFILVRDFWLASWSEQAEKEPDMSAAHTAHFIEGFIGWSVGAICAIVGSSLVLALAAYTSGVDLHKRMLDNIIKLPFRFFDTNPLVEIMERFTKDIDVADTVLFRYVEGSVHHFWCIIVGCIAISIVVPYFAIAAVIILIIYLLIQQYYLKTSRELQNLDNSLSSPIISHFVETLEGRSTIKAYRNQQRMFSRLMKKIDSRSTAYLYLKSANIWMNIRFDLMGAIVVLIAGYAAMGYGLGYSLHPALVALAIVYAQKISTQFSKLAGFISYLGTQMESIARIKDYTTSTIENYQGISTPPNDWPMRGSIRFENLYVKYDEELDPVLERIYLNIHAGEKIGICGGPGSGKTSLIMSLLRSNVVHRGRIYIDGYNITGVSLTTLRRQLSLIPYQPSLIKDTVRNNLDPEGVISDEELWDALTLAEMKPVISLMPGGLNAMVSEGGSNFSAGQRQLFCLARAFLRKSRILIMDDISPAVDNETVEKIQEVLKNSFANRTIIMVASDVSRILSSDKVVVMSDGTLKEFDTPKKLLANPDSLFTALQAAST